MFRQKIWMIPLAYLIGLGGIISGLIAISYDFVSISWLWIWLLGHLVGSLTVTVALHRYFSHGSFTTNKFWHTVMAVLSNLVFNGSPQAWSTAHIAHHEHSDTDRDPHLVSWRYLIWKTYRQVPLSYWRLKHLSRDPILKFTHRYALLLVLTVIITLYLISPWALLFGYIMPLGSVHFIGAVHTCLSHRSANGARSMPFMEFILPASGEWHHKHHHDYPRDPQMGQYWYHLDFGYWLIKAIRN